MDTNFRVGRGGFGPRSSFTYDQFPIIYANILVFKDILKTAGTLHRPGKVLDIFILVKAGYQQSTLGINCDSDVDVIDLQNRLVICKLCIHVWEPEPCQ